MLDTVANLITLHSLRFYCPSSTDEETKAQGVRDWPQISDSSKQLISPVHALGRYIIVQYYWIVFYKTSYLCPTDVYKNIAKGKYEVLFIQLKAGAQIQTEQPSSENLKSKISNSEHQHDTTGGKLHT